MSVSLLSQIAQRNVEENSKGKILRNIWMRSAPTGQCHVDTVRRR